MVQVVYLDDEGLPIRTAWLSPDEAREQANFLIASFSRYWPGKPRAAKIARALAGAADTVERRRVEDQG